MRKIFLLLYNSPIHFPSLPIPECREECASPNSPSPLPLYSSCFSSFPLPVWCSKGHRQANSLHKINRFSLARIMYVSCLLLESIPA